MSLLTRIGRNPQYVFHPVGALRRLTYRPPTAESRREVAQLPWGLPLEVHASESIGFSILAGGIFDPPVTETLHRLIDPGDLVVDIGANIGYMTSLAAVRTGRDGCVLAFEPHPQIFGLLERNVARWRGVDGIGNVELQRLAVSDRSGEGTLVAGPEFAAHMGMAALGSDDAGAGAGDDAFRVSLARLDEILADADRPGLVKIDVEGHEPEVLGGSQQLLEGGAIRDIVFEDHDPYPSEATTIVEAARYSLISLENDLFGLRLRAPQNRGELRAWPGPSYLATRQPERARERLEPRGWRVEGIMPRLLRRRSRG